MKFEDIRTEYILSYGFDHAIVSLEQRLNESFGNDGYEILDVRSKFNFYDATEEDIGNTHPQWESDDEKSECPVCALSHTVLDNQMNFSCSCGCEFKVADNGWTKIICNQCQNEILREEVTRDAATGKLTYAKKECENE